MKPAGESEPSVDGSRLCLACGLCCQGLLHDWVRLRNVEVEPARRLGLSIEMRQGEAMFAQPCPCHQGGRCMVYQERPSPCREYRCKLLRGCLSGKVSWEEGLLRVEQAQRLVAAIRGRLGAPRPGASLWQQVREDGTFAGDSEARLEIAALLTQCQRHFWMRAEPRRALAP